MPQAPFPRVNVLGVGVHATNMQQAVDYLLNEAVRRHNGYVCLTGVHGVMEAQDSLRFRRILNESLLTAPDGMPMVWIGRSTGFKQMDRVFGPELMLNLCRESVHRGLTHFLYGGSPGVADELKRKLESWFPGLNVVGTYTPPFRPLNMQEHFDLLRIMNEAKPDIIWVGLSTPKQERFMAEYVSKFPASLMLGVGAAFDLHTGRIKDSPHWVKRSGLQWAHRLLQDPARLWKRYLVNNPMFVIAVAAQMLRLRRYELHANRSQFPPLLSTQSK